MMSKARSLWVRLVIIAYVDLHTYLFVHVSFLSIAQGKGHLLAAHSEPVSPGQKTRRWTHIAAKSKIGTHSTQLFFKDEG